MRKDDIRNGLALGDAMCSMGQVEDEKCEVCGAKLTDDEVDVLLCIPTPPYTMCFDCAKGDDERHPDEFERSGKSPYEL